MLALLKRAVVLLALLGLAGIAYLNYQYLQDPPYWRRWWDLVTHLEPDHMNFSPTVAVQSERAFFLPAADPKNLSVSASALTAAQQYAEQFDSFALIVVHRGVIQTEWYGEGWRRDKQTQSQSMMKTLTALMTGLAIADGYIASVEDPISRYFPEWQDDPRGEISVRNLLQMTSGLAQYRFTLNPFPRDSSWRFLFSSDRLPVLFATPLAFAPGSRFEYNDIAAQLTGTLVERAAGQPYASYLRERLWGPMGGQYAELWLDREGGSAMTACCMLAAALDWAKVGVMLKDGGRINGRQVIPEQWVNEMLTPSPQFSGFGYYTWLGAGLDSQADALLQDLPEARQSEPFLAEDLFMLLGYGGQRVYVSRSADLVVVRLGPFAGMQPLAPGWDNAALPNLIMRGIQ